MPRTIVFVVVTILAVAIGTATAQDDGQPFGPIAEKDFDAFIEFAKTHGLDVEAEMNKVYAGDAMALARVLKFAAVFDSLDSYAKVYGNMLYSTFLNLMERQGSAIFIKALDSLPENRRQRARDFFYYPMQKVPKEHRAEVEKQVREDFPAIFPPDYEFAKNDSLFK